MYACMHFMFICTYIIFSISTLIVQQEFFHLQSILIQTLRLNYTVDVYTPEIHTTSCTSVSHAGRAKHDSHRQPGNQLQFSWGRGLATGEWQHARQPHGQAVIIWFTHNQLLIVSHWSAGTCNLEQNMNSQGLLQAELSGNEGDASAFMCLAPGSSVLETRDPDFCALTVWSTADMTGSGVASQYNNTESSPSASVFCSEKNFKRFFSRYIVLLCSVRVINTVLQQYPLDYESLQFGTILYKVCRKKNCVAVLLRYNIGQLKLWIMWHSVCSYIKRDAINHLSLRRKQTLRCNTPS